MPSRFLDELPPELTDAEEAPSPPIVGTHVAPRRASAPLPFHVGDDVVHATFGEGVVTGTAAGGIVTVRFAADGSERQLMADYAPLRRRQLPRALSATIIDGKAIAVARVRARGRSGGRARMGDAARPRDRARRRRPRLPDLRGRQAQGLRGGRHPLDRPRAARGHGRGGRCSTLVAELNADPAVSGIIVQLPLPAQIDAGARDRRRSTRSRTSTG